MGAHDEMCLHILPGILVLFCCTKIPTERARHRVGRDHRAQGAAGKTQQCGSAVLNLQAAHFVAGEGLHLYHLAQHKTQHVDVVDQVNQNRATAWFSVPLHIKISVGFVHAGHGVGVDNLPQAALGNDVPGAAVDGVVPPVVAHQHGYASAGHRVHQFARFAHIVGNGFFNQGCHTALQAIQRTSHVGGIGCRHYGTLGFYAVQQAAVVGKPGHVQGRGQGFAGIRGVGNGDQHQVVGQSDAVDVGFADDAGTNQGNSGFCHKGSGRGKFLNQVAQGPCRILQHR